MNERQAAAAAPAAFTVRAKWDNTARAWIVDGGDIPGLAAQADTFDALADLVFMRAPELLRGTGAPPGQQIRVTISATRRATAIVTV